MIMEKQYIKPEMNCYDVHPEQLLCLSGVDETEVNFGEGYPDEFEEDDQNNYW